MKCCSQSHLSESSALWKTARLSITPSSRLRACSSVHLSHNIGAPVVDRVRDDGGGGGGGDDNAGPPRCGYGTILAQPGAKRRAKHANAWAAGSSRRSGPAHRPRKPATQ